MDACWDNPSLRWFFCWRISIQSNAVGLEFLPMPQGGQNHRFIEVQESSPCNCLYLGAAQSASRHQMSVGMSLSRLRVPKKYQWRNSRRNGYWKLEGSTEEGHSTVNPWCMGRATNRGYQGFFPKLCLNLPVDDSFNDVIHRFKDGPPCSTGKAMLRSQLEILSEQANANPYDTTDSDVEEAYPPPLELLD